MSSLLLLRFRHPLRHLATTTSIPNPTVNITAIATATSSSSNPQQALSLLKSLIHSPKPSNLPLALSLFHSFPSTTTFNALLTFSLSLPNHHPTTSLLFSSLPQRHNLTPDLTSFNTLLLSHSLSGSTRHAYHLFDQMLQRSITPNTTSFTHAISGFYHEQRFVDVRRVLGMMASHGCNPFSLRVYNARIRGLCSLGRPEEAEGLYREMLRRRMKPNWVTFDHLIVGYCEKGELSEVKRVYGEMGRAGCCRAESGCYFKLVNWLCKGGDFVAALGVCEDAMGRNWVPCFKTMRLLVNGLVGMARVEEGMGLVRRMKERFPGNVEMWEEVEQGFT